ncbi:cysteine-rich CWC family protein [Prolixibacter sp. NT017]|uniref:cysteine-rich CWC family protein n=1 Tax=Prolixibacter sp. NT017 TaxID=2652390 RepID=UPI00129924B7
MGNVCPRCGSTFECQDDEIQKCWCARERLPAALCETLRENYDACLCLSCISELQNDLRINVNQTTKKD